MKLFSLGNTQVRLHFGLIFVIIGALVLGMLGRLLQAMLALTMHEAFHAVVAHAMGYQVDTVEFMPYGGVARMAGKPLSNRAEFVIALAGPLCNLVVAGGILLAASAFPAVYDTLSYFLTINVALALFNLLPALPLDGGRMLRALLSHLMRPRAATLLCAWIGIASGALLLLLCALLFLKFGLLNPFLLIMGVFLVLGAARELTALPQAQLSAMLRRKDAFARGEALPLRQLAVRGEVSAGSALRQLSFSRYTLLQVLDDQMRIIGQLDEGRLLAGIARYGRDVAVGTLVKKE